METGGEQKGVAAKRDYQKLACSVTLASGNKILFRGRHLPVEMIFKL